MSCKKAISIKNISKLYKIYNKHTDRIKQLIFGKHRKYYKDFWALKNISLDLSKGKTLGIIGKNGSGKSTLLQIICGTSNPSAGSVVINGKVSALLELGAGFNPEFTGIENIYLSGSLYGLSKVEIDKKLDQIKNFADIGDHLYQPVKTYSSGMFVRLAFAIISNVNADILVIDEALSVGDLAFTQKCMRFIREFQKNKTLIFVSHDLDAILNLCDEVVWINNGIIKAFGPSKNVVELYTQFIHQNLSPEVKLNKINNYRRTTNNLNSKKDKRVKYNFMSNVDNSSGWSSGYVKINKVNLFGENKNNNVILNGGERVRLVIIGDVLIDLDSPIVGFLVKDRLGQTLFGENTFEYTNKNKISISAKKKIKAEFIFHLPYLPNGEYSILVSIADGNLENNTQHCLMHEAYIFNVSSSKISYGLVGIGFDQVDLYEI